MHTREVGSIAPDEFAWALGALAALHRIPFDAPLLLKQFPPPTTLDTILLAARALGLEVHPQAAGRKHRIDLPALVLIGGGASSGATSDSLIARAEPTTTDEAGAAERVPEAEPADRAGARLALIVRLDGDQAHYFLHDEPTPRIAPLASLQARALAPFAYFSKPAAPVADPDARAQTRKPFGFAWFVPELLKHKRLWREVLLGSLVIQLLALATPIFTQVIIDKVVVHHTVNTLVVVAAALLGAMLFSAALTWVRQYLVLHTGNRVDAVLGSQVFDHLVSLPARYFEQRTTGVLVARLHGVETIREFVSGAAISLLLDLPFLFIFLAIMFWYSWPLTLVALAFLTLIVGLSLAVVPGLRRRLNEQFLLGARNQSFLTEYVSGMETVKSLQMEPTLKQRYGQYLASYLTSSFNTRQLSNTYGTAANTLEQLMTLTILCLGAWLVMRGEGFTIGMLVAFQMFAGRLSQPMLRLTGLWQELQQAVIAVKRLGDILDAPAEPYSLTPTREASHSGRIEIQGLSFRYAPNLPDLFQHFDLTLEPGSCVALMGPSGSGKSTLAKLLQGFYWPQQGSIRIDGHDIAQLSANELRATFGVVPQETTLFAGTLYDNLTLANPSASFKQVIQACKLAEIHRVIERLPQGYQSEIGEHGAGLSGGQKQRIAIARALLKRPKVLIFDEATSHLDQDTAEQFAKTLRTLKGKVTLLFIAHQLPKGLPVDRVVKLTPEGVQVVDVHERRKAPSATDTPSPLAGEGGGEGGLPAVAAPQPPLPRHGGEGRGEGDNR